MNNTQNTIDYYFQETMALEYEITHQILLKKLLEDANFAQLFTGIKAKPSDPIMEPLKGKFDLQVNFDDGTEVYIECKYMSVLYSSQLKKQTEWLEKSDKRKGIYFLLGTKDLDMPGWLIEKRSGKKSRKVGHEDLLEILDQFLQGRAEPDLTRLAQAYRTAIAAQWKQLTTNWKRKGKVHDHFYYYSFFYQMQKHLDGIKFRMYPVTNRGGTQYGINADDTWLPVVHNTCKGKLYLELLNNQLCIRCQINEGEHKDKRALRRQLIDHFRTRLGDNYPDLENGTQVSKYMYVVRTRLDFEKLGVERVAEAFGEWWREVKEYPNNEN